MGITVGIDLGTTNSAIAHIDEFGKAVVIPNAQGEAVTPSCVAFTSRGVLVGSEAKALKQAGAAHVAVFFKREMGNDNYLFAAPDQECTAVDLSALVITKLKEDAEARLGKPITDAVITVPAYFREKERRNTVLAGEKAGLTVLKTINEPTAAALSCGTDSASAVALSGLAGQNLLVYDLGGGTFDVTLLNIKENELTVISSEGDYRLGGKDWDERIVDWLLDAFSSQYGMDPSEDMESIGDLLMRAEEAKKRLSSVESTQITLRHGGQTGRFELSRTLFEELTSDLLHRTRSLCEKLLAQSGVRKVDNVVLVGGSTRMHMVRDLIQDLFKCEPLSGVNEDEAVALGAVREAFITQGTDTNAGSSPNYFIHRGSDYGSAKAPMRELHKEPGKQFKYALPGARSVHDVTTHSLGAIAVTQDGSRYVNEILITKDTPVPCANAKHFMLDVPREGSSVMDIYLTQGETPSPADVTFMNRHVVRKIPGNASGKARIEVSYSYDSSGMVQVHAKDTLSGSSLPVTREHFATGEESRFLGHPSEASRYNVRHSHVLLVIDLSASMTGAPLAEAQKAAHRFVDETNLSVASVGLAVTADKCRLLCPPTRDAKSLKSAIDALDIGMHKLGFGNEAHPFDVVYDTLDPYSDESTVAVVLADGIWYKQDEAVAGAKRCHDAGIDVVAIGFGTADKDFLRQIASADEASIFTRMEQLTETFSRIARVVSLSAAEPKGKGMIGLKFNNVSNPSD